MFAEVAVERCAAGLAMNRPMVRRIQISEEGLVQLRERVGLLGEFDFRYELRANRLKDAFDETAWLRLAHRPMEFGSV